MCRFADTLLLQVPSERAKQTCTLLSLRGRIPIKITSCVRHMQIWSATTMIAGEDLKLPSDLIQSTYLIMKILFWFSAIFWDTVAYFIFSSPSDNPTRTQRRCQQKNIPVPLIFAPASWMLMTHSILLLPGIFYGHKNLPTFHTVKDLFNTQSAAMYDRITKLETMIDLDWTALWNFNQIKWESIHNDLNPCVL